MQDIKPIISKFLTPINKNDRKNVFLVEMALRAALSSSTRNNPAKPETGADNFRFHWKTMLLTQTSKINKDTTISGYADIVMELRKGLHKFSDNYKVSHAQKSLSLFLKYLWCYGLVETPPTCPIDRQILKEAQKADTSIKLKNWTKLDSKEDYIQILKALEKWADHMPMAEKELIEWNNS